MPLTRVIAAAAPWLAILISFLVIVTYVPILSTYLPDMVFGPQQ